MEPSQPDFAEEDRPWIGVAHFPKVSQAREVALALSALGIPYAIDREENGWVVKVELSRVEEAQKEVGAALNELCEKASGEVSSGAGERRWALGSLFVVAMVFVAFGVLQGEGGEKWKEAGLFVSQRIWSGQWWRLVTALTLHGDLRHWGANLAWGLVFGGLLIPRYGQARTWALILGSGILGNTMNALFYSMGEHRSLGASTAIFGAIGLMTGGSLRDSLSGRARSWWRWVVPPGAGLGLLATLGTGGGEAFRTDVLAHLFGFLSGGLLGLIWPGGVPSSGKATTTEDPDAPWVSWIWGGLSAAILVGAWWAARVYSLS